MASDIHDISTELAERRAHRRLAIRLPVECRKGANGSTHIVRTVTRNISTGGLYLELDAPDFHQGDHIQIELTIPAAEGVSPYPGQATCDAEILRTRPVLSPQSGTAGPDRFGIAARFLDDLRLFY